MKDQKSNSSNRIVDSGIRRRMIGAWVAVNFIFFIFLAPTFVRNLVNASFLGISSLLMVISELSMAEILSIAAPIITGGMIYYAHKKDREYGGCGIRHMHDCIQGQKFDTSSSFASMAITKQSIFAAIALGLLVFVGQPEPLESVGLYGWTVRWAAVVLLTLSLFSSLVSVLCYDYSQRFKWGRPVRVGLLNKGHWLDIGSWYALTSALVYCSGTVDALLALLVNAVYGSLLLYYYFFNKYCHDREQIFFSAVKELTDNRLDLADYSNLADANPGLVVEDVRPGDENADCKDLPRPNFVDSSWCIKLRDIENGKGYKLDLKLNAKTSDLEETIKETIKSKIQGSGGTDCSQEEGRS